jgi:hypothetical protein
MTEAQTQHRTLASSLHELKHHTREARQQAQDFQEQSDRKIDALGATVVSAMNNMLEMRQQFEHMSTFIQELSHHKSPRKKKQRSILNTTAQVHSYPLPESDQEMSTSGTDPDNSPKLAPSDRTNLEHRLNVQDASSEVQDLECVARSLLGNTDRACTRSTSFTDANRNASIYSQASLNSHYDLDTDSDEAEAS